MTEAIVCKPEIIRIAGRQFVKVRHLDGGVAVFDPQTLKGFWDGGFGKVVISAADNTICTLHETAEFLAVLAELETPANAHG